MDDTRTVHVQPPLWLPATLIVAVLIGGGFYVYGKNLEVGRQTDENMPTISVNGEGKISSPPDIASLSLGVQTGRQPTAKQASDMLTKNMQAVIDAVKKLGVEEKDISTENFYLQPVFDWKTGVQNIAGYEGTQSIRVKVRDLDKSGEVLSAATAAGANQSGGIQFTIDDPEKARSEARTKAIAQAKEKAETLAQELGMRLGKVRGFNEGYPGSMPSAPVMLRSMGGGGEAAMDMAMPLPQGEQDVVVSVSIIYELY